MRNAFHGDIFANLLGDYEMTQTTPEILQQAKEIFWLQTESWTGDRWDWEGADDEVQARFIKHAANGTRPWSKADSEAGVLP